MAKTRNGKTTVASSSGPTTNTWSVQSTKLAVTNNDLIDDKVPVLPDKQATTTTNINNKTRRDYKSIEIEEYEGYARCLSPREEQQDVDAEFGQHVSWWKQVWRKVWSQRRRRGRTTKRPGTLILLRSGQSEHNQNSTFTGWLDPPLTSIGIDQCRHAGRLLMTEGLDPDVVYSSRLQRSITSAWTVLECLGALYIPIQKTYRLNNRMYGALQGLSKEEVAKEFGPDVVQAWRNSLKARPPPLSRQDPSHPIHDRRYSDLDPSKIPDTESLLECQERARVLWEYKIRKDIQRGKAVLVVAHRDTLRGLCKAIDSISDKDIGKVAIPRGQPIVYKFDKDLIPIEPDPTSLIQVNTKGVFLEKPQRLEKALARNQQYEEAFAYTKDDAAKRRRVYTLEQSLLKLRRVEEELIDDIRSAYQNEDFVKLRAPPRTSNDKVERWSDDECEFEEYDEFVDDASKAHTAHILPLVEDSSTIPTKLQGPYVVFLRHGRTPHNNMQLFTGWEDPPLAEEGIEDAKNAGRLLKLHGVEFDVVYTSWLTRAIQTAYYCLLELDTVWLPMVKSWRLNERMYGALTGKSKKMIATEYGEDQLKKWRRGYTIRPPPTSSYSPNYPGNDERRAKHYKDLPISFRETWNRSLERRRLCIHRKFPKTESLKDCMDRSIPFYAERIQKEAVEKGKRVLITSHENALRGILMHLCDIPESAMNQLHLPNGLPLVYNIQGKCISLLDDGSCNSSKSSASHDFGPAAKYLFKSCELDDDV